MFSSLWRQLPINLFLQFACAKIRTSKTLCLSFILRFKSWLLFYELLFIIAPTRVEFLFRVLLSIGAPFRVVTPHSSVPLRIPSRSCAGKTQKHGTTCLLKITIDYKFSETATGGVLYK